MKLKSIFYLLLFSIFLISGAFSLNASELDELIEKIENDVKIWQINRAADSIDDLFNLAKTDEEISRAHHVKAVLDFYLGDYQSAKENGTKALSNEEIKHSGFHKFILEASSQAPKFDEIKSENFIIRYAHPNDLILAEYAKDVLEKSRFEIGLDLDTYPDDPVLVEIYPDMESFTLASTLPASNVEKTGVVGICKFNRIMILSPRLLPKGYTWADTLAHEYVHYLVFQKSENTVPVWLHEGIAKFQESRWKEKESSVMSPFYETILSQALENNELVPIERMHPSLAMLDSARQAQLAFAQSGTMVDYLVSNWGKEALVDLIESIKTTDSYEQSLEHITGLDFSVFYDSWEKDLRSKNLEEKIPDVKVKGAKLKNSEEQSSDGSEDLVDIDNNRARDYTRLGDLLKQRGRLSPASYEYEKALSLDPTSAIISSRLASTLNSIGKNEKAKEVLFPILDLYPNNVDIHMVLGRIYLEEGNFNKAHKEYLNAVYINPYDPQIHASLAVVYEKLGQSESKEREENFLKLLLNKETDNGKQ